MYIKLCLLTLFTFNNYNIEKINILGGYDMKKNFVTTLLLLLMGLVMAISPIFSTVAYATNYDYVNDKEGLYDDSSEMYAYLKELRQKLDFEIHVYSVKDLDDANNVFDEYIQKSNAVILAMDRDGNIYWYTGASVKHTVRDVDMEEIIEYDQKIYKNRNYTEVINLVLTDLIDMYINGIDIFAGKAKQPFIVTVKQIAATVSTVVGLAALLFLGNKFRKRFAKKLEEKENMQDMHNEEKKRVLETPIDTLLEESEKSE